MNLPPEAVGAAPAMGNPDMGKTPTVTPEQMAKLRQDPEIAQAVQKYLGRPFPLEKIPEGVLTVLAGMVFKLGVDGAVAEFTKIIPQQAQQKIKSMA